MSNYIDAIVIGYNKSDFQKYAKLIRKFGEHSEEYHDLRLNSVPYNGDIYSGLDLFNYFLNKNAINDGYYQELDTSLIPNLAGIYLTNYLNQNQLKGEFIGEFKREREKLIELLQNNPKVVAITTTFYTDYFPVQEMVSFIRKNNSQTQIVVGGPLIANYCTTYEQESLWMKLKNIGADIYVNEPQGEKTLVKIVQALDGGTNLSTVPNLIYQADGQWVATAQEAERNPLDDGYIRWKDFDADLLGSYVLTRTVRGCPFSCSFCSYPVNAKEYVIADIETIEKELRQLDESTNVQYISFIDDTFNIPKDRFKKILKMMIDNQFSFQWFCYCRAHLLDEEIVQLMKDARCSGVFLGLESGSDQILHYMNKQATREKYLMGIRLLQAAGIMTFGSFIVGFPGETEATVQETIDFIKEAKLDFYRAELFYYDERTPIAERKEEFKLRGRSYKWSHETMDSKMACEQIERIFRECSDSTWMPKHDLNFFNLPYFLSNGFSMDLFREYLQMVNQMILNHLNQGEDDSEVANHLDAFLGKYRALRPERQDLDNPKFLKEQEVLILNYSR